MKHLFRAGVLLLGLFAIMFILPRVMPIPGSLLDFGFHKPNAAKDEQLWASLPISYAQSTACSSCHQDNYRAWQQSNHKTVACENCHGAANAHLNGQGLPEINDSRELCGTCHARVTGRPVSFPQVDMNEMGGQAACSTCHNPHDPRAGMPPRVPHELEDRTNCQSCHAPHEPIVTPPPVVPHSLEGRTNCLACHGQQQVSRPVAPPKVPHSLDGRSDCLVCHNAGGIKPFPKDHAGRASGTCLSCHGGK
ncbi:MAG: hypothetical protein HY670_07330 [Chloroflexi bacterium]|nr:hypothetical protein [Chloroflexota bacterium]